MRPVKALLPVLTMALVLAGLAGCGGGPSFRPIDLVPQDANFVAEVQVARIINDKDIQKNIQNAYNESLKSGEEPATWDELLAKFTAETGIDLHQFTDAVIFGSFSGSGYFCGVAEGNFNQTQFIENVRVKTESGLTSSSYKGYTIYTEANGDFAFAFLSNKLLLFGTVQPVKDSIDVSKGDRDRLRGQLLDTYKGLGGGMMKAALQIPESARQSFLDDSGDLGFSLKPFADIDAIGMSVDKSGNIGSMHIEAHFVSSASARDAKDTVNGLFSLIKGLTKDQATKDLFGKFQVAVTDSTLTVDLSASLSEWEKAGAGFGSLFGGG